MNHLALQQDFAAKVVTDNLCILLAACNASPRSIRLRCPLPNRTYALGTLKPRQKKYRHYSYQPYVELLSR